MWLGEESASLTITPPPFGYVPPFEIKFHRPQVLNSSGDEHCPYFTKDIFRFYSYGEITLYVYIHRRYQSTLFIIRPEVMYCYAIEKPHVNLYFSQIGTIEIST